MKVVSEVVCIQNFFSCAVVWRHADNPYGYVIYIYTLGFVGPLAVISTSYFKIIK